MRSNVICCRCGQHKSVKGKLKVEEYFPTKYVYVEGQSLPIKCDGCLDNYMIIENDDYIDLLGKTSITGTDKEFIRKSNEVYIDKVISAFITTLAILRLDFDNTNSSIIAKVNRSLHYWETAKFINSKV